MIVNKLKTIFDPPWPPSIDWDELHGKGKLLTRHKAFYTTAVKMLPELKSVTEIGFGGLQFVSNLLLEYPDVQYKGYDISNDAIIQAVEAGLDVERLDITTCNGDDIEKVDYIIMLQLLEHLKQPEKAIYLLLDRAHKGVLFSVPDSGRLVYRLQLLFGSFPRQCSDHLRFWTKRDMLKFLKYHKLPRPSKIKYVKNTMLYLLEK